MKKVLLIQPHSDDIVFSCFHKLLDSDSDITILSVEHTPKRFKEDKKLEEIFPNVKVIQGIDFVDNSYYEYYKVAKTEFSETNAMLCVIQHLGDVLIDKITNLLSETCTGLIGTPKKKWDEIYVPLGVGHPFHLWIHKVTDSFSTHFYQDWPHSYKRRNNKFLIQHLTKFQLTDIWDDEEGLDFKLQVAKEVYKSQSSLMFFEQNNIKKHFSEKIYEKK